VVQWNGFDNRFVLSGYIILEYEKAFEVLKHQGEELLPGFGWRNSSTLNLQSATIRRL
jgi:hypothetical protein